MKVDHSKHLYDAFANAFGKLRSELLLAKVILVPTYTKFIWDMLNKKKRK
jgi:hypothetical protein